MIEVMKYKNLALEKNLSQEELDNHNDAYAKLFHEYSKTDLANEYEGYKTIEDKRAPEYAILCKEIKSHGKSIDSFVKQNRMTKTDINSLNFYKKLNKRGVGPGNSNINYLRFDILDVFGYDKLKVKSRDMKDCDDNTLLDFEGKPRKLKISQNLENLPPENVRGFANKAYNHGEKVWNRIHGKK